MPSATEPHPRGKRFTAKTPRAQSDFFRLSFLRVLRASVVGLPEIGVSLFHSMFFDGVFVELQA